MEITNNNLGDDFDPTPRLKSSPVPILFIPFNQNNDKCSHCENEYSWTLKDYGKYCKNCLSKYVKYIEDNNKYLDVEIRTKNAQCIEHNVTRNVNFYSTNIQEWCE